MIGNKKSIDPDRMGHFQDERSGYECISIHNTKNETRDLIAMVKDKLQL